MKLDDIGVGGFGFGFGFGLGVLFVSLLATDPQTTADCIYKHKDKGICVAIDMCGQKAPKECLKGAKEIKWYE